MSPISKDKALARLRSVLDVIPELKQGRSQKFKKWQRDTRLAVSNVFGDDPSYVNEFASIQYSADRSVGGMPFVEYGRDYVQGLESAGALLESMIDEIREYWEVDEQQTAAPNTEVSVQGSVKEVFVVHGRDDGAKETVARFLTSLGLNPVILHEQPNQGRTIIEKFEEYSKVGFAIVLLTPDDTGAARDELGQSQLRARQNVILELGFFLGKLGRHRTCALLKEDVEIPSDYRGVLYINMDGQGAWKSELVRELRGAGLDVDTNHHKTDSDWGFRGVS